MRSPLKQFLADTSSKKALYDAHRHRATTDTYRKNMVLPEHQALLSEHSYSLGKKMCSLTFDLELLISPNYTVYHYISDFFLRFAEKSDKINKH